MELPKSLKKYGEDEIRQMIETEFQTSYQTILSKRERFRLQDELLNYVADTAGNTQARIDLRLITRGIETLLATYLTDDLDIRFHPRTIDGAEQARNLTRAAKFDHKEMRCFYLDYQSQMDRFMRGVGIQICTGWDKRRKVPIFQSIDARTWVPDPNGWFDHREFRFHGFQTEENIMRLSKDQGYDMEKINEIVYQPNPDNLLTRVRSQLAQGLYPNQTAVTPMNRDTRIVDLYHHFTTIDGRKYMITLADNRKYIVRVVEDTPVYECEKDDPSLIDYPVALYYFYPDKFNPYGLNVPDFLETPHRYANVMVNLMFLREKDAALGPDVLVDTKKIKNVTDFESPSLTRRFIPVNDTTNAVAEIPVTGAKESSNNFLELLKQVGNESIALDSLQMGVTPNKEMTLGETQQLAANNNLRSILKNKINNTGEEQKWKIWHRQYAKNFGEAEKKLVRISGNWHSFSVELKRNDFVCEEDPDVEIISTGEDRQRNEAERTNLAPVMMMQLQDPNISPFVKTTIIRKLYEINGLEYDEAIELTGQSWEEIDALHLRALLDKNDPDGAIIDKKTPLNTSHETYIAVFREGAKTVANDVAIRARYDAIKARDQMLQQQAQQAQQMQQQQSPSNQGMTPGAAQPGNQGQGNMPAMANMALGSALNQQQQANQGQKGIITRANVTP